MSAVKQRHDSVGEPRPEESGEYVRVPAVIDSHGDKVVTLIDEHGLPQTRLMAELVLEAFRGPCPPGHTLKFKDGNRLNCELANLEWAAAPAIRAEAARAKAIATRDAPMQFAAHLKVANIAIAPSWYARIASDDE